MKKTSNVWQLSFFSSFIILFGPSSRMLESIVHFLPQILSICSDKCEIVYVSMFEVIFDRNGAKVYVKNLRVLSQRKIRETYVVL
jgi:hypothetical protein